jgi:hypothetical protein
MHLHTKVKKLEGIRNGEIPQIVTILTPMLIDLMTGIGKSTVGINDQKIGMKKAGARNFFIFACVELVPNPAPG